MFIDKAISNFADFVNTHGQITLFIINNYF